MIKKWLNSRIVWGIILILGGVVFLLQNVFNLQLSALIWTIVFGLAGVAFLSVYFTDHEQWWSLIPGLVLLGIAATIFSSSYFPGIGGELSGIFVLGSIGISFLLVYLLDRQHWWALIPAGVMVTLCLLILLQTLFPDFDLGGFFLLGLGVTFGILALIPTPHGQMKWAWIPAGILFGLGIFVYSLTENFLGIVGPLVLIALGGFFIVRTLIKR